MVHIYYYDVYERYIYGQTNRETYNYKAYKPTRKVSHIYIYIQPFNNTYTYQITRKQISVTLFLLTMMVWIGFVYNKIDQCVYFQSQQQQQQPPPQKHFLNKTKAHLTVKIEQNKFEYISSLIIFIRL